MEMETDEGINSLKARIETQHKSHMNMLSSVQSVIPNFVSSLDLSLKVLSSFNHRPFSPTPPLTYFNPPKSKSSLQQLPQKPYNNKTSKTSFVVTTNPISEKVSPLSVVRSMVAVCLLSRLPFVEIDSSTLSRKLENDQTFTPQDKAAFQELAGDSGGPTLAVEIALRSMADDNGAVELEEFAVSGKSRIMVLNINRTRLLRELPETAQHQLLQQHELSLGDGNMNQNRQQIATDSMNLEDVDALINKKSFRELQKYETAKELLKIIQTPSIREAAVAAKFKTKGGSQMRPYCDLPTKEDCRRRTGSFIACNKLHFRRIIALHTDISLGDCPFLRTCRHMNTCKYVHYEDDPTPDLPPTMMCAPPPPKPLRQQRPEYCSEVELGEPQWINCDIRNFRMDILGKFGVIMADPPWDIHMELPYGTMADDEMRTLNVAALQTHGLIFLWVTGRAMELGRECLERWGYKCVEEIIWVKTNQLQRIIRTGRTGHWLNHSKEHCLVGIKGSPEVNRNIDTDVIVSEVRETSRKPDEMYALLERISPGTRKVELFARMHNTHAGWMSLGNQLSGVRLVDEGLRARFKAAYPDVEVQPASPSRASAMEVDSSVAAQTRSSFSVTESMAIDVDTN